MAVKFCKRGFVVGGSVSAKGNQTENVLIFDVGSLPVTSVKSLMKSCLMLASMATDFIGSVGARRQRPARAMAAFAACFVFSMLIAGRPVPGEPARESTSSSGPRMRRLPSTVWLR